MDGEVVSDGSCESEKEVRVVIGRRNVEFLSQLPGWVVVPLEGCPLLRYDE